MSKVSFCGVFVGELDGEQAVLVLAVSPQQTFGCFRKKGSIVMGKSYGGSGGITLTEINAHEASYKREFAFTFDGTSLVGASSSGSKATVVLVLDSEIPCSRFAGEAVPDESLKVMLKEKKVFFFNYAMQRISCFQSTPVIGYWHASVAASCWALAILTIVPIFRENKCCFSI